MSADIPVVHENVSLKALNTLGVQARASFLVRIESTEQLCTVLADTNLPARRLVLGGGSNILFRNDFDGLVIHNAIPGRRVLEERDDFVRICAGAGENWHDFVAWTLSAGHGGLENLSLIPGSVGAAPIQNIGAYAVELSDRFDSLTAVRLADGAVREMTSADCHFGYRHSVFRSQPGTAVVTELTLKLPRPWEPVLHYGGLRVQLEQDGIRKPDPDAVSNAVCAIRRRKLPDPARLGNVGSFFKNPTIPVTTWAPIHEQEPGLVCFPEEAGQVKIAAASLIEHCGWKGFRDGDAGVSEQHALVLVNYGAATGEQIWQLAERIRESVSQHFGIELETEPVVI